MMNIRQISYRDICLAMIFMVSQLSLIECQLENHKLHGIGYREQELQQAKGSRFTTDTPQGISWASFAGGTNIFIKGYGFNPNPESNTILLFCRELDTTIVAPMLTEDDAFGSHTKTGYLQYRLPAVNDLLMVPRRFLDSYLTMTFDLSVSATDGLNEVQTLVCPTASYCQIKFVRSYTPIVHYLSPPVVYFESMTEVWFNPKSTQNLIQDLQDDEMYFINTKIAGNQIDFEFNVDSETTFGQWRENRVTGQVGDQLPEASQNLTMLWETGYADNQETENLHCSYDNSTCYQVKTVPVIFETSANTGYKTGGQNLTLTGHGLNVGNVTATVGGVPCTVTAQSNTAISCFIGETANASATNSSYVGHHGLRRTLVNTTENTEKVWMHTITDETKDFNRSELIATTFATPYNEGTHIGNVFKGWFIPPVSTEYRFYMACDDHCLLRIGKTAGLGPEGFNATEDIITTYGATSRRLYHYVDGRNRVSEWRFLEANQSYYIESHHVEGGGNDHFSVAVEINQTNSTNVTQMVGHHHAVREIQYVGIHTNDFRDTIRITIDNPDGGEFKLVLVDSSGGMYTSSSITMGKSTWDFNKAIREYYWTYHGSNIDVTTIWYDVDGNVTTVEANATKMEYNVTLQKLIDGASVKSVFVSKTTTKATMKVELPATVQTSSTPVSGKFRVKCVDAKGAVSYSEAASYNEHNVWFDTRIMNNCTGLYDRIETWDAYPYAYKQNGRGNYIHFKGINEDPGQFEIISDWDTPLVGDNITFVSNTSRPYSSNLWYDPVPFEMLKTYDTIPQIVVTVNDLPVVCHNITCGYNYTEAVGEIASFTFDAATNKLTLVGTLMPANASDIYRIQFAQSDCILSAGTASATGLECILEREPTCGSWVPKLTATLGVIPNSANLATLDVACAVTAATPDFDMNIIGGDNITISGEHFPWDLESNTIEVNFTDAGKTPCIPQVSNSVTFVCLTTSFNESIDPTVKLGMVIVVNNLTITNSLSLALRNTIKSGVSITPNSVSPVLKQNVTIQLEADFPYALVREHFTVNATSETNSSYVRYMNVIDVDDANKKLVCKFGGAWSGKFSIRIRHNKFGLIKSTLLLDVSATTTTISRNTGSIYGGTYLAITGKNYGSEITDNPVQISTLGSIGSLNCYVITTNATMITCRTDETREMTPALQGDVVVFLKTSEESPCEKPNCQFTYTSNIPTISTMQANFDAATSKYKLMVTGTDFTGTTSTTELYIGGILQQCDEVTATSAKFTVTNIPEQTMASSKLYFDVGIPKYHGNITAHNLTLEPKLISLNIQEGSIGGSLIKANVQGVGSSTKGLDLVDTSSGSSICKSVVISAYGVVECTSIAAAIAEGTNIGVKLNGTTYNCSGSDTTLCQYKQLAAGSYPAVTSIDISTGSMVFTGANFPTATTFAGNTTYCGIYADTTTVNSATEVSAVWTLGIPPCGNSTPVLTFTKADLVDYASNVPAVVNNLVMASTSAGLSVSWAGGQQLQVQAAGLSSLLKGDPSLNNITVCENLCVFSEADSTSAAGSCTLPEVSTSYSDTNFNIQTSHQLDSGVYTSHFSGWPPGPMFDGDVLVPWGATGEKSYFGMKFKKGYVAVLDKVKYYVPGEYLKSNYINNTQLLGSNDGFTTTTVIYTVEDTVASGWNYINFDNATSKPKFNEYRFKGSQSNAVRLSEVQFFGVESIASAAQTHDCFPKLYVNGTETVSTNAVTYSAAVTPNLTAISPRFGTVQGGEPLTFTGTGFPTAIADINITIDGVVCAVQTVTATEVKCLSAKRPGYVASSLQIYVKDKGYVATNSLLFTYVNYWSHDTTWGMEFAPMAGESIHIPTGLNLYMDIDKTPELNLIIVEGELIIGPNATDPNHHRYFDAHYILVSRGKMQVGTEDFPYTSKITITMHSMLTDPYLPLFGNKCIGLTNGILDMHGPVRVPTWTTLNTTAEKGATTITLSVPVDWVAGEEIAIASTSFNGRETDKRTIVSIDKTNAQNPVLVLDKALDYGHFAATETYGDKQIDMRAEVGLLTRNIKYKGDDATTEVNQYGAIIFMHSAGDDSLAARLSYTEFTNVGQAFKQGRYPIHFHLIGEVPMSYAKGNSVHKSFNRAFTIHGTKYLRIIDNVAFDTKGHTIFIEDGIERRNLVQGNLIMMTKRSWSLLNTDQTPAAIWITNPDNDFIGNHAAGSDRYSYWYDLQEHAIGPSADTSVCPENEQVGIFKNNHAHSNGRYGLRIFHNMVPRKFPCSPIVYNGTNVADPWHLNPIIQANFYNLTAWKNKRNGAIAKTVGDIRFHDFKVADNMLAGIEMSVTNENTGDGGAGIYDALVVGKTGNVEQKLLFSDPKGIIAARSENFTINTVQFYNFDWKNHRNESAAALSTCSHCFHPAATDSGARTITVSNLTFDATCTTRIRYEYPYKAIFYDLDGTLTGKGAQSWATYYYPHHNVKECEHLSDVYDGVTCDNTAQVRRLSLRAAKPAALFAGMEIRIVPYDDHLWTTPAEKEAYLFNKSNYGNIIWKKGIDTYAAPYVTGHKYKVHFGQTGLDFEQLQLVVSERWKPTDKPIYMVHNHTDVRANITITDSQIGVMYANNTIPAFTDLNSPAPFTTGQMIHYPDDTGIREVHYVVTGKDTNGMEKVLDFNTTRCTDCYEAIVEVETVENTTRLWSDPKSWPNGTVPVAGDDVHIESGWNVTFDMENSPVYGLVRVNGFLTFLPGANLTFNAKHIFIRAGELHIGTKENPHNATAIIKLHGEKDSAAIAYDNAVEVGNKVLANYNVFRMFGMPRQNYTTKLLAEATKDQNEVTVEAGLDWVAGDRIVLLPTGYTRHMKDDVFISSYDNTTGKLKINSTLNHYHWGAAQSTAPDYNGIDTRGDVVLLTRNVKIVGEDIESWGGNILVGDTIELDGTEMKQRIGHMILDHVEIYNNSQIDTFKAAIRFEQATGNYSRVTNCSIHNGFGWAINVQNSDNIEFADNIIYNFRPVGVGINTAKNISFHDNIVSHITQRETFTAADNLVDKRGAIVVCAYYEPDKCVDIKIYNNLVAGAAYAGFVTQGQECGDDTSMRFKNNIARGIDGEPGGGVGGVLWPDLSSTAQKACFEAQNFTAYKCTQQGVFGRGTASRVILKGMTMMDNQAGFGYAANIEFVADQQNDDMNLIELTDNYFYGETPIPDCPNSRNGDFCIMEDKYSFLPGMHVPSEGAMIVTSKSAFPIYNHHANPTMGGRTVGYGNNFVNYNATTPYGKNNMIFGSNAYGSDYTEPQEFFKSTFTNVENAAIATLDDPDPAWANKKDCGEFPCTAPYNVLFSFKDTTWKTLVDPNAQRDWQLIANNPGFAPYVDGCSLKENWNGYECFVDTLSILFFENDDWDAKDRNLAPIYMKQDGTQINNKLNSYMDHIWDGFYSGQVRWSRYPAIVNAKRGITYDVEYTGNTPKNQTFTLKSQNADAALILRIFYPDTGSFSIYANDVFIESNAFNDETKDYEVIQGKQCGENRFLGIKNVLEFYITKGCFIKIKPRDAIQTMVRMEWSLNEFFSNGGTTTFADRVAGSLGIHASDIKIVSVYEGSLVVNYDVTQPPGSTTSIASLQAKQTQAFATGGIDLGAPILDVAASVSVAADDGSSGEPAPPPTSIVSGGTVSAEGYDPIVITTTAANRVIDNIEYVDGVKRYKSVFRPNIQTILEEETVYQNITVQKVIEDNANLDPTVIKIKATDDGSTSWIIIMVAASLLAIVGAVFCCRFFVYQSQKDMIEAERRIEKNQQFAMQLEKDNMKDVKAMVKRSQVDSRSSRVSSAAFVTQSNQKLNFDPLHGDSQEQSHDQGVQMAPEYAEQYDPNQDFGIFQVQNQATGGIMTMQEKMNIADNVNNNSSSDEDDEDLDQAATADKLKLANQGEILNAARPSSSESEKRLTFNSLPMGESLPEDQEIISELDEEEEEDV